MKHHDILISWFGYDINPIVNQAPVPWTAAVQSTERVPSELQSPTYWEHSNYGKSSESVQCAITGPCLHMRHRHSALYRFGRYAAITVTHGCQATRHTVNSSQVNSSPGQLVTQSTRHKEAVNSSQANKQAN